MFSTQLIYTFTISYEAINLKKKNITMATNKHAIIRYQALDLCFSNSGRRYYIEDLIEACNDALYDYTGLHDGVKRRQVYSDINFMESEAGYSIPLERIQDGARKYFRYSDSSFSINKQPLSPMESEQLKNTIVMLNRFKGLPQFEWMEEVLARFEDSFKLKANIVGAVGFEQNYYLKGLEFFTPIFNAIINKQVLNIVYRASFGAASNYIVHPYFLKQYNNRWFLFGLNQQTDRHYLMNMAIDRIDSLFSENIEYIDNNDINFEDYFADVVGVTVPYNRQPETIRLKISKSRYSYIETKPMHPTQKVCKKSDEYVEIELTLIPNYEFETMLLGFADSIEILEPLTLKEAIIARASKIIERNN